MGLREEGRGIEESATGTLGSFGRGGWGFEREVERGVEGSDTGTRARFCARFAQGLRRGRWWDKKGRMVGKTRVLVGQSVRAGFVSSGEGLEGEEGGSGWERAGDEGSKAILIVSGKGGGDDRRRWGESGRQRILAGAPAGISKTGVRAGSSSAGRIGEGVLSGRGLVGLIAVRNLALRVRLFLMRDAKG